MRRILGLCFAVFLFTSIFSAKPSFSLNAVHHRPTTGATGGYRVHTTETLELGEMAFGLDANFADDWFESKVFNPASTTPFDVGDQLASFNFLMSYGLMDWLTFNFDLPVHFFTDNNLNGLENNWDMEPGDLLFSLKARVLDAKENDLGIGLALIPFITAPTGQSTAFQGDASVTGGLNLAFEKVWESTRIYANTGGRLRRHEFVSLIDQVKHEFLYGLGLQQTLVSDWDLDLIAEVTGSTDFQAEISSPAEALMVLRKTCGDKIQYITSAGAGIGLNDGYGSPDWRAFGSFTVAFGGQKKAPPPPPPRSGDSDGDGLTDESEINTYRTNPKDPDTDKDGLMDGKEVHTYGTDPLNENTDGDGCKDGEEVFDYKTNPKVKDCPPQKINLKGKINFKLNSSDISPSAYPILDDAIRKMEKNDEIAKLEIEGHSDSSGDEVYNLKLSERRANSVKQYFIKKGVDPSRLTSKGYGENQPIAPNNTREGRAQNRRIVFRVIKWK